jgi:hypothetical protein
MASFSIRLAVSIAAVLPSPGFSVDREGDAAVDGLGAASAGAPGAGAGHEAVLVDTEGGLHRLENKVHAHHRHRVAQDHRPAHQQTALLRRDTPVVAVPLPQGIQGEKGDTGVQGEQGARGLVGERGPPGVTGQAGAAGPRGFSGKDGKDGKPAPKPVSVDCVWGDWSVFGSCDSTCGKNSRKRRDRDVLVFPQSGGKNCEGGAFEFVACPNVDCPKVVAVSINKSEANASSKKHVKKVKAVAKSESKVNLVTCSCTGADAKYKCTDGKEGACIDDEVCFASKPWDALEKAGGCQAVKFVGCYKNVGDHRKKGHYKEKTIEWCTDKAKQENTTFFGLEHPQLYNVSGRAKCLPLEHKPHQLEKATPGDCEDKSHNGFRMGSGHRLALYRIVKTPRPEKAVENKTNPPEFAWENLDKQNLSAQPFSDGVTVSWLVENLNYSSLSENAVLKFALQGALSKGLANVSGWNETGWEVTPAEVQIELKHGSVERPAKYSHLKPTFTNGTQVLAKVRPLQLSPQQVYAKLAGHKGLEAHVDTLVDGVAGLKEACLTEESSDKCCGLISVTNLVVPYYPLHSPSPGQPVIVARAWRTRSIIHAISPASTPRSPKRIMKTRSYLLQQK